MLPLDSGTYDAFASGYTTKFTVDRHNYIATFDYGVRGINIADVVEVADDGKTVTSKVLGTGMVSLKVLM